MPLFCPDAISFHFPALPISLRNRVFFVSTCALTPKEETVFSTALSVLAYALSEDKTVNPKLWVNVYIIDRDTVSFTLDNPKDYGLHVPLILLPIHRWRASNYNSLGMYACILEEFCHHFWCIRDEVDVKLKTFSLIQRIFPTIQFSDLYNLDPSVNADPQ